MNPVPLLERGSAPAPAPASRDGYMMPRCPSGGAWQLFWHWDQVRDLWKFLGGGDDGKENPGRGNAHRFALAIQPRSQPLGMYCTGAVAAGLIVRDGVAGLAEPRLIERDQATLIERIDDLSPIRSLPTVPGV